MYTQFAVLRRAFGYRTRHHGDPEAFTSAAKDAVDGAEFDLAEGADAAFLQDALEAGAIRTSLAQNQDVNTLRRSEGLVIDERKFGAVTKTISSLNTWVSTISVRSTGPATKAPSNRQASTSSIKWPVVPMVRVRWTSGHFCR